MSPLPSRAHASFPCYLPPTHSLSRRPRYIGNPLFKPINQYEIPALARMMVKFTLWLHKKIDGPGKLAYDIQTAGDSGVYPLRFNLRVLADKRTLIFLVVMFAFASLARYVFGL